MGRTFKSERDQRVYDIFADPNPPVSAYLYNHFKRGKAGVLRPKGPSPALAAWLAGHDAKDPKPMTNDTLTRVARIIDPRAWEFADKFAEHSGMRAEIAFETKPSLAKAQALLSEGLLKEDLGGSCGADSAAQGAVATLALFTISAQDLYDLTTHAATASSAAADDNKRRERDAWAQFDAIINRVRTQPADITDQDFELTPEEQAMADAAWKRHEAAGAK